MRMHIRPSKIWVTRYYLKKYYVYCVSDLPVVSVFLAFQICKYTHNSNVACCYDIMMYSFQNTKQHLNYVYICQFERLIMQKCYDCFFRLIKFLYFQLPKPLNANTTQIQVVVLIIGSIILCIFPKISMRIELVYFKNFMIWF